MRVLIVEDEPYTPKPTMPIQPHVRAIPPSVGMFRVSRRRSWQLRPRANELVGFTPFLLETAMYWLCRFVNRSGFWTNGT
jgi:hypothetical protein